MEEGHGGKTPVGSTDQTHKGKGGAKAGGKGTGQENRVWHIARTWEKGRGQVQGARARFKDRSSYVPGARSMVFIASIAPTIYSLKCPKE